MEENIKNYFQQFAFAPVVENADRLKEYDKYIICGVGASARAADLLSAGGMGHKIKVWRDYGLPETDPNTLFIISSYSGTTEETIDSYHEARQHRLPVAVVTSGGELLISAKQHGDPYVQLPNTGTSMMSGYAIIALMKLMGSRQWDSLKEIAALPESLNMEEARVDGETLAHDLRNKIPIICASRKNYPLAYNWKAKLNERARLPAFASQFPELNHNDMTGIDPVPTNQQISENFTYAFLEDESDDPRILKRMRVLMAMYREREIAAFEVKMAGKSFWHKVFQNLLVSNWTVFYLAQHYGTLEEASVTEEFEKRVKIKEPRNQ